MYAEGMREETYHLLGAYENKKWRGTLKASYRELDTDASNENDPAEDLRYSAHSEDATIVSAQFEFKF